MKKFCAKIVLYSIVSVVLVGVNSYQGFAAPTSGELEARKNVFSGEPECINEDGADKGYLITFIEEPLDATDDRSNPEFIKRLCYRQTLQYSYKAPSAADGDKAETGIVAKVTSSTCSTTAQQLATDNEPKPGSQNWVKYSCREIQVLLSKGGTTLIYGYIGMIYRWGASMVGVVAVLIIVLSGIQISAAGGDPEAINKAKTRILQSIGGIVVLFLSGLILYTINPTFFVK